MLLSELLPDVQMYGFLDSTEVLPFARGNNVSVAFLDIELCESSGLVLAKQLMEINPHINIIFLTCHSEYTAEAIRMHASGYIMKPPTESDVLNELKHLRYPVKGLNI
ncbi:MAG: response regulator, partial [Blautia sp.]|nr:response regulator [Blautia sp.]